MPQLPTVIAIAGPSRSGSSCLAGVVQALGVPMGESAFRPNWKNPRGFFEDKGLCRFNRTFCRGLAQPLGRFDARVRCQRRWAARRAAEGPVIGGKHRALAISIPEMTVAWPQLKILVPDRPAEEILASMRRIGWIKDEAARRERLLEEIAKRDGDLQRLGVAVLRCPYQRMISDTAAMTAEIIAFLGIAPTDAQRAAAAAFVSPQLKHVG
jgi:hypothetical protein